MERGGQFPIVVEILVEIGFTVAIQIVQSRDLVMANHVNTIPDNFASQRLMQTRRKPLPSQMLKFFIDPRNDPDIAAPRRQCSSMTVGKKVERANPHPRVIRVFFGNRQRVHNIGFRLFRIDLRQNTLRLDCFWP